MTPRNEDEEGERLVTTASAGEPNYRTGGAGGG